MRLAWTADVVCPKVYFVFPRRFLRPRVVGELGCCDGRLGRICFFVLMNVLRYNWAFRSNTTLVKQIRFKALKFVLV